MKPLVLLFFSLPSALWGAFEPCAQGARSAGMSGAMVACRNNAWTAFSNPAFLAALPARALSLAFCPALFGLREISRISLSYVEPTAIGSFALSGTRFGFSLYRETGVALSYGVSLGSSMYLGGSLAYENLAIKNYGSDWTPVADLGFGAALGPRLSWGMSVFNVGASAIGAESEELPEVLATGLSGHPLPEMTVNLDLAKDLRYPLEIHVGVEYTLLEVLFLRAGLATEPSSYSAGIGLDAGFLLFDYAFSSHPSLGFTHQVSLLFEPGEI